ncbi:hypothetical protein [Halomonas elongata]|uniref:hypothetical protein n=1 Tax=Halomonas elongata TaxID=2746 RepID=UPI0023B0ECE6|nr:hypothetical protein [Halomonas elongata]
MSSREQELEQQVRILRDALVHAKAASLDSQDVLISVTTKLVQSGQVFTDPEAQQIQQTLRKANEHHQKAHDLVSSLIDEGEENGVQRDP